MPAEQAGQQQPIEARLDEGLVQLLRIGPARLVLHLLRLQQRMQRAGAGDGFVRSQASRISVRHHLILTKRPRGHTPPHHGGFAGMVNLGPILRGARGGAEAHRRVNTITGSTEAASTPIGGVSPRSRLPPDRLESARAALRCRRVREKRRAPPTPRPTDADVRAPPEAALHQQAKARAHRSDRQRAQKPILKRGRSQERAAAPWELPCSHGPLARRRPRRSPSRRHC